MNNACDLVQQTQVENRFGEKVFTVTVQKIHHRKCVEFHFLQSDHYEDDYIYSVPWKKLGIKVSADLFRELIGYVILVAGTTFFQFLSFFVFLN